MSVTEELLKELGQSHLLAVCTTAEERAALLADLTKFGEEYEGGVASYVRKGRALLTKQRDEAANGSTTSNRPIASSPSENTAPTQPEHLFHIPWMLSTAQSDRQLLEELEREATETHLKQTAFVLVAGGLGERLGYPGIKVSLPVDTFGHESYLEHYASFIRARAGPDAPFVLMTSDDTHARTVEVIEANNHFGLTNLHLLKQSTVLCLADPDARVAIDKATKKLLRKPHGHGDVHSLLYASGFVPRWQAAGLKNVVFFQDTNAAITLTVPLSLSISARHKLAMNFTCVPRLPGEAVGALMSIVSPEDGVRRTVNVEYNLVDSLLSASGCDADVPVDQKQGGDGVENTQRFSRFPGSINTLLVQMDRYAALLSEHKGFVPEFVNPKYVDSTKTAFKSPTRLECLMQDYALLLNSSSDAVGGTIFDRRLYAPVKNALLDGIAKVKQGLDAHCASTGEAALYHHRRSQLEAVGVTFGGEEPNDHGAVMVEGKLPVQLFPMIHFDADFASGVLSCRQRFPNPSRIKISRRSSLSVRCGNSSGQITIESLELDGALSIDLRGGAEHATAQQPLHVVVRDLAVSNEGVQVRTERDIPDAQRNDPVTAIRGFWLETTSCRHIVLPEEVLNCGGTWLLSGKGEFSRLDSSRESNL